MTTAFFAPPGTMDAQYLFTFLYVFFTFDLSYADVGADD
jgi:hypothetical protein